MICMLRRSSLTPSRTADRQIQDVPSTPHALSVRRRKKEFLRYRYPGNSFLVVPRASEQGSAYVGVVAVEIGFFAIEPEATWPGSLRLDTTVSSVSSSRSKS